MLSACLPSTLSAFHTTYKDCYCQQHKQLICKSSKTKKKRASTSSTLKFKTHYFLFLWQEKYFFKKQTTRTCSSLKIFTDVSSCVTTAIRSCIIYCRFSCFFLIKFAQKLIKANTTIKTAKPLVFFLNSFSNAPVACAFGGQVYRNSVAEVTIWPSQQGQPISTHPQCMRFVMVHRFRTRNLRWCRISGSNLSMKNIVSTQSWVIKSVLQQL